jgi:hypothetical protein
MSIKLSANSPDGFVVHSHAGDDWQDCRDYVRQRLGLPEWQPGDEQNRRVHPTKIKEFDRNVIDREAEQRRRTDDDLLRIQWALDIWNGGVDPRGTVAERYLASRALQLPDDLAGPVLRFHPRCPWQNEDTRITDRIPALIAAFRSIDDNQITAVHRIRLDQPQRWPKTDRRMLGPVQRSAVKLGDLSSTLTIGEGVETCLAARQLGLAPVWALGGAGAISFFPVLDGITILTILGEADSASTEAIRLCSRRWQRAFRKVKIAYSEIGSDINDALIANAKENF